MATDPDPIRVRDAETVLHEIQQGYAALGVPKPPPDVELQMTEALDYFTEQAANPYRVLPPVRGAVVAFLRGVASALNEDDLGEWFRWPTASQRDWWDRGFYGTHSATFWRFDRWDCTFCGHRVGGAGPEHAPICSKWSAQR